MTKAKLHETVLNLCKQHEAPEALVNALSDLTKPKVGGSSDVNDYTVFDTDGNVTHVFCTYHQKWEPVITEIEDEDGELVEVSLFKSNEKVKNGFERTCMEGNRQWSEQSKVFKATNESVVSDLLEGDIDNVAAKELLADAAVARAKHTERTDGIGSTEKPGSDSEAE